MQSCSPLGAEAPFLQQTPGAFLAAHPSSPFAVSLIFCSVSFPISSPSSHQPLLVTGIFDCSGLPTQGQGWPESFGVWGGAHGKVLSFPCNVCSSNLQGSLLGFPHSLIMRRIILCYLYFNENLSNQMSNLPVLTQPVGSRVQALP